MGKSAKVDSKSSKFGYYIDKIILILFFFLFCGVPLIFNPYGYEVFELPKLILLQSLTILIITFTFLKMALYSFKKAEINLTRFNLSALDLAVILFLLINIIASIFALNPRICIFGIYSRWMGLLTLSILTIIYFLFKIVPNKTIFLPAIIITATLISIYGLGQRLGFDLRMWDTDVSQRIIGTLGQPNFLGAYLIMIIPLALSQYLEEKSSSYFYLLGLIIIFSALIFTYSRASYLGLLFSILTYLFFIRKDLLKFYKKLLLLALLFIIITTTILYIPSSKKESVLKERLISAMRIKEGTVISRLYIWKATLKMIKDRPLTGYGLGNFSYGFFKYKPVELNPLEGVHRSADKAHNEFLDVAANSGILAFFSYLFILGVFFFKIKKPAIASSVVAYIVQNLFSFSQITHLLYFFLFLGLAGNNSANMEHLLMHASRTGRSINNLPENKNRKKKDRLPYLSYLYIILTLLFPLTLFLVYRQAIADIYFKQGMHFREKVWDLSLPALKSAVRMNPIEPFYKINLAGALELKGDDKSLTSEEKIEYYQEAIRMYEEVKRFNPQDPYIYHNLARSLEKLSSSKNEYLNQALKYSRKATVMYPNNIYFREHYGIILGKMGRLEEAERELKKVISLNEDYILGHYNLANIYYLQRRWEEAIKEFEIVIKEQPRMVSSYLNLGMVYYKLKDYEKAEYFFQKVVEIDPEYAMGYNNLGAVCQKLKKTKDAKRYYEKAFQLDREGKVGKMALHNLKMLKRTK